MLNAIDLVEPDEPMPKLPVAHAVWKPRPDMRDGARVVADERRARTTRRCRRAVDVECIADLAEILRTELVVIDAHTTTRAFANELRWNQAYYRLAQGL